MLLISLPVAARADHLNPPEADWFIVVVTAGESGATEVQTTYRTNGRTTGDPMVFGLAMNDGEWTGGGVSGSIGPGVRVGAAGAAQAQAEILPSGGSGGFGSTTSLWSDVMEPGQQIAVLFFATGTLSRPSPVSTKAASGSVSAEMITGTGSKAVTLLDATEGVAADLAVVGAGVSASYVIDSPGLFGAFTGCYTCLGQWTSPDGRRGDNRPGSGGFSGPAGQWTLAWHGATYPAVGWQMVGGYAPIGEYWKYFDVSPGILG